MNKSNYIYY